MSGVLLPTCDLSWSPGFGLCGLAAPFVVYPAEVDDTDAPRPSATGMRCCAEHLAAVFTRGPLWVVEYAPEEGPMWP